MLSKRIPAEESLTSFRKAPQKFIDRHYLLENNSAEQLARKAAFYNDELILELLLDRAPMTQEELKQKSLYNIFLAKKSYLIRKMKIKEIQIATIKDYYAKYDKNILAHVDEINRSLCQDLQELLYALRLENRSLLIQTKEIISKDKILRLDTKARVQIHKNFSTQLEQEFQGTLIKNKFNTFEEGTSFFNLLIKEYYKIKKDMDTLYNEYREVMNKVCKFNTLRTQINEQHCTDKNNILSIVFRSLLTGMTFEQMKYLTNIAQHLVPLTCVDPINGNNLLHIACSNGHFEIALFLIKKGVDWSASNLSGISPMDTTDRNGNTLIHYLVSKGDYRLACKLLAGMTNPMIKNKSQLTALDIVVNNQSLIHYLLEELNKEDYRNDRLGLFLHLLSHHLLLSPFLIKNLRGHSAFFVLLNSSNVDLKIAAIDTLKKGNLQKSFKSQFQADINTVLWTHFASLSKSFSSWLSKKIHGLNEASLEEQLQFLTNLQDSLEEACAKNNDFILYDKLRKLLDNKMPNKFSSFYETYLCIMAEQKKLSRYKIIPANEKYFIQPGDRIHAKNSGKESLEEFKEVTFFNTPIATESKKMNIKNNQDFCNDPLHWFSSKTSRG